MPATTAMAPDKCKQSSSDLTGAPIFEFMDDNSPLSSSVSSFSDEDCMMVKTKDEAVQGWLKPKAFSNDAELSATTSLNHNLDPDLYATAGSQRPRRQCRRPTRYTGITDCLPGTPSASEDEAPVGPQSRVSKRKNISTAIRTPTKAATKNTRSLPARNTTSGFSRLTPEQLATPLYNVESSTPAASLSVQSELWQSDSKTSPERLSKKTKISPNVSTSLHEYEQSQITIDTESSPLRRVTRSGLRSQPSTPARDPVPGSNRATALPAKHSLLLKLKITSLGQRLALCKIAKRGSSCAGELSQSSSPLLCDNSSTSMLGKDSISLYTDILNQCGQSVPAPIALSSQADTSFGSSEGAYPMPRLDEGSFATRSVEQRPNEHDFINNPRKKLSKATQWLSAQAASWPSAQPDASVPQEKAPFTSSTSFFKSPQSVLPLDLTQPTIPLDWTTPTASVHSTQGTLLHDPTQATVPLGQSWEVPHSAAPPSIDFVPLPDSLSEFKQQKEIDDCSPYARRTQKIESEQKLQSIAALLARNAEPDKNKPAPAGQPKVWAEGRQQLCETLHYYRAYQGACYSSGGFLRGIMLDGESNDRDYLDGNVILSRAGGGLVKDSTTGEMKPGKDQAAESATQGLRNCITHQNPVVVITGLRNKQIPSQPPHQYCVLDYFKPTHTWVEKCGQYKIVRYRFEKLNPDKDSWWRAEGKDDPVELGSLPPAVHQYCSTCNVSSPQIYLNGWMCLQPECVAFWKIVGPYRASTEPEEASLMYDPRFLKQRTPWATDTHDYPLVSNNPVLSGMSVAGEDTSQAFWNGIVCPDCGRCISRLSWQGWECGTEDCGFSRRSPPANIPATTLREAFWPLTSSYTLSRDVQGPLVGINVSFAHGYRINRYSIPGIDGFITHMIANKIVIEEPNGPDAMFEKLQTTDIGLRRSPIHNQLRGDNYTRHFLVNYGMPYKFVAATASHSFAMAASPICNTRSRLNWAAKYLMCQETNKSMEIIEQEWRKKEFNEILALGYFEKQAIDFHDDGESGLGPTIATLSLGAPGTMRIRMKDKYYHGVTKQDGYVHKPPLPGCKAYDARRMANIELANLAQTDRKAYTARLKTIGRDLGLRKSGHAKDALTMELGHGDIVVMHGAGLQKYYEHSVSHAGKMRFALTCRYIDPDSLNEKDKPIYEVVPDEGGYDGSKLC